MMGRNRFNSMKELNEMFNLYWRRVVPLGQTSSIAELYEGTA